MRKNFRIFALIMVIVFAATMLTGLGINLYIQSQQQNETTNDGGNR